MDILTYFVIFVALEVGICAMCSFVCRERRMMGEQENPSKKTSHHSAVHPPHITHGIDHQKEWSHAFGQQPKGKDNKAHLSYLPPRIHP